VQAGKLLPPTRALETRELNSIRRLVR
jgi:hypothetical protein